MSERQFTRSCPLCGAVSPLSTPACLRCNHAFPPATIRQTVSFSYKKTLYWIAGVLLAAAFLLVAAVAGFLHARLSSTMAYREALKLAKPSPAVEPVPGTVFPVRCTAPGLPLTAPT